MVATSQGLFTSSLPELYERFLVGPLFRPFAEELLDRAGLSENDRLLDIACGTGIVARLAQERLGVGSRVVGVDVSPGMLAMAKSAAPAIDWREGDAARLPIGNNETFDIVTCHQGLQFFADRPVATREMRRVLAPAGRLVLATWQRVEEIPLMRDLQRVAETHLGTFFDQRHSFGDPDAIRRLLTEADFSTIRIETITRTIRLNDGAAVFGRLNTMAVISMSAAAKSMSDEQRAQVIAAITNDSIEAMRSYIDGNDLVCDLGTNIATARA